MIGRRFLCAAPLLVLTGPAWAQSTLQAQLKTPPPASIPIQWYGVQVVDNAFVVEMPGVPDHRIINDSSARGAAFALHSYSLDAGGNSYVAQTALYPQDVDTTQPKILLQAALDDRAQQLVGHKWRKIEWHLIDDGASVESIGSLPNGQMLRQLVLLKEHRFVSLAFMGANVTGPEANRFFNSLKLS